MFSPIASHTSTILIVGNLKNKITNQDPGSETKPLRIITVEAFDDICEVLEKNEVGVLTISSNMEVNQHLVAE